MININIYAEVVCTYCKNVIGHYLVNNKTEAIRQAINHAKAVRTKDGLFCDKMCKELYKKK